MYTADGDKFLTPKHTVMPNMLHHATWSKELVIMFQQADHVMSHREVIKLDTALAKIALEMMESEVLLFPKI